MSCLSCGTCSLAIYVAGGSASPLVEEVEQYEDIAYRRLLVKPVLPVWWQVSGRSDLSWEESVRLDLYYVGELVAYR